MEEMACAFLKEKGALVLARNFRSRTGEIDIVAMDGDTLVFAEVKYRTSGRLGDPEEAVGASKQRSICRTADFYRIRFGVPEETKIRFDVLALRRSGPGSLHIRWIRDAFPYMER